MPCPSDAALPAAGSSWLNRQLICQLSAEPALRELYASWPKVFLGQESENHSAHFPSDPHERSLMVAKHHKVTNICTMGKRWLFSFSRVEKMSGTSKQDEGMQVSHHTPLLPWASISASSKADMAAPHSTLSSTGCLPSRDSQHTHLGCHHMLGCCSVPIVVKQARRVWVC